MLGSMTAWSKHGACMVRAWSVQGPVTARCWSGDSTVLVKRSGTVLVRSLIGCCPVLVSAWKWSGDSTVTVRSLHGACTVRHKHFTPLRAAQQRPYCWHSRQVVSCTAKSSMPQMSSGRPRLEIDVEQVQELLNQRFTLQEAAEQLKVLERALLSNGIAQGSTYLLQA